MADTILIGLGAQKAATTWLTRELAQHPEVAMASPKELHYWDTVRAPYHAQFAERAQARLRRLSGPYGLRRVLPRPWGTPRAAHAEAAAHAALLGGDGGDHAAYLAYLRAGAGDARVIGEITPAYALCASDTFAEMAALAPGTRFLFVMRDPLARLVSGVRYRALHVARAPETAAAVAGRAFDAALASPHDPNLRRSRYDETIAELEAVVPPDRILYLFYETLFSDAARDALTDFLGLSHPPPWRAQRRDNSGAAVAWAPSEAQLARAAARLAPTYAALRRRFGDAVPASWGGAPGTETLRRSAP